MALPATLDLRTPAICVMESEKALIGIALYSPRDCVEAFERVRCDHFHESLHGVIWELARAGVSDPTIVAERLKDQGPFKEIGGLGYLATLIDDAQVWALDQHVNALLDAATRREIDRLAKHSQEEARRPGNGDGALASLERGCAAIARDSSTAEAWVGAGDIVGNALAKAKASKGLPGISTGLTEIDQATGGFRKGQLITIAGRPAMGKSTGGLQIVKAVAQQRKGALFYSMEMPDFDLGLRLACDVGHDPYAPLYNGRSENPDYFRAAKNELEELHWRILHQAREQIAQWPIAIDTRPGLTVSQMLGAARRKFRAWEREGIEPGVIVVDHLTIARPDQDRKGNKVAEVGDISRGLAEMAKTLDVPVVALCQLSRDVEKRAEKDRRPGLSDLRWSGEIEQDARLVMFLYRPEYYVKRPEDREDFAAETAWREKLQKVRHKLFWLIEKNNNGPTGEVETYCDISCSAIRDRLGMAA